MLHNPAAYRLAVKSKIMAMLIKAHTRSIASRLSVCIGVLVGSVVSPWHGRLIRWVYEIPNGEEFRRVAKW